MKNLQLLILGLVVALSACGKKSSGTTTVDPYNTGYQQPQYSPPNYNWSSYNTNYIPQGHCGYQATQPTGCNGTYNGYSYCGNQWYYYWNSNYWAFPAFGSCGNTGGGGCTGSNCGGGNNNDDDWWTDDDSGDTCGDSDDDDCGNHGDNDDDDDDNQVTNYNSGWKKVWGVMGSSENEYVTVKVPKNGIYYVSFKGDYTGKKQDEEKLTTLFNGGKNHGIKDLDQSHTGSGEVTRSCKVNVNFQLKGGATYKLYLKGNKDSVNDTYLRITSFWPGDISKLCN